MTFFLSRSFQDPPAHPPVSSRISGCCRIFSLPVFSSSLHSPAGLEVTGRRHVFSASEGHSRPKSPPRGSFFTLLPVDRFLRIASAHVVLVTRLNRVDFSDISLPPPDFFSWNNFRFYSVGSKPSHSHVCHPTGKCARPTGCRLYHFRRLFFSTCVSTGTPSVLFPQITPPIIPLFCLGGSGSHSPLLGFASTQDRGREDDCRR